MATLTLHYTKVIQRDVVEVMTAIELCSQPLLNQIYLATENTGCETYLNQHCMVIDIMTRHET